MTGMRRRPTIALLAAVLALALGGCSASTMNAVLNGHANSATAGEVNGADNGASIPIGNDKFLLLFNDAYVGPLEPDLERPPGSLPVNNVVVSWDSRRNTTNTYIGAGGTAQFKPADPANFYWLTNGVKQGSTIHFLAQERRKPTQQERNYPLIANVVISVPVSNLDATPTVVRLLIPGGTQLTWGEGIVAWGDHWYVYGAVPDYLAHRTLLARVPLASLGTLSSWRYYRPSDGRWSMSQSDAGALLDAAGGHVPHMLHPVVHDGEIVSLASSSVYDRSFRWAASATPWGVVTVGGNAYSPPESGQPCGSGGTRIVYSVHPHDQSDPAESLWSYSTSCWAPVPGTSPGRYAPDYRPRFINLDLADAPTACPLLSDETTRSFVTGAYTDMRRRSPGAGEVDWWTREIAVKGYCRSRLITELARDTGYLGTVVDDAYELTLRRPPSEAIRAQRVSRILDGTEGVTEMHVALLASGEFLTAAGGTDSGFVTLLYQRLLGIATPSPADLEFWVGRTGSQGRAVVAREIYESAASRARRVNVLAQRYLGRSFADAELDYWRTRLGEGANDDITVTRDLVNTAEYMRRAEARFPVI